jgi:DNA-binding transcriptional MerR regulator
VRQDGATQIRENSASEPAFAPASDAGVYGISVAADLAGCGVQALRSYERRGLLDPGRTAGGTRRYSQDDVARVRRITSLLGAGLNLSGIREVLTLEAENAKLRAENAYLRLRKEQRKDQHQEQKARPRRK